VSLLSNINLDFLKSLFNCRYKKKKEILDAPNYNHFGKPPSQFDPFSFDIEAARERLRVALATSNSVRSGAKKFTMPINPDGEDIITEREKMSLKKGQELVKIQDEENSGFWHETKSTKKDKSKEAVCAACGRPAANDVALKQCSGCHQVLYALFHLLLLDSGHLIFFT
jgi:hypothetical protein